MKKGQVTAFVIVGLILLVSTLFLFYIRSKVVDKELIPLLDDVGPEHQELQGFILGCVRQVGEEALIGLGEHGGYIDPTDPVLSAKSFDISPVTTESDLIYISEDYAVPYWWYMKSNNRCTECEVSNENIPTIIEVEEQVDNFVEKSLKTCLSDFEYFKQNGFTIKEKGEIKSRTLIARDDVVVYVNYPLQTTKGGISVNMENFPVTIDIPFLEVYSLAVSIAYGERDSQFLESILMHLISAYSDVDPKKLPPLAAFDEGTSTVLWSKTATHNQITDLLKSYIPFIQIENTKGYQKIDTPDLQMYDIFTLMNNATFNDTSVNFAYLGWPIYFDITPRKGEILEPSSYEREFPFGIAPTIQTNHYEFFYDIAYPVIVDIRNDKAFGGLGYSFVFGLEGNILDNKNLALWHIGQGTYGPLDLSKVQYDASGYTSQPTVEVYIPETGTYVNVTKGKKKKRLFCNENQRISKEIEITVLDTETSWPVANAEIKFGCGTYSRCTIGTTDTNGKYKGSFPVCVGEGYVVIKKEGYAPFARSSLTIKPETKMRFKLKIKPLRKKPFDIMKIHTNKLSGTIGISEAKDIQRKAKAMTDDDQIIMYVTKVKDDPFEDDFIQIFNMIGEKTERILLSEGKYTIVGTYIDKAGVFIPKHNETVRGQLMKVPEINMTPAPLGGVLINKNDPWLINRKHLEDDKVTFYVFASDAPESMQDIEKISEYETFSKTYRLVILPSFNS